MASFPEPKSLNILEIGGGAEYKQSNYTLEKPHPGYGIDPNIINEYGHTVYPKMVYPNGKENVGVVVKSKKEEAEVMGDQFVETKEDKLPNAWQ